MLVRKSVQAQKPIAICRQLRRGYAKWFPRARPTDDCYRSAPEATGLVDTRSIAFIVCAVLCVRVRTYPSACVSRCNASELFARKKNLDSHREPNAHHT